VHTGSLNPHWLVVILAVRKRGRGFLRVAQDQPEIGKGKVLSVVGHGFVLCANMITRGHVIVTCAKHSLHRMPAIPLPGRFYPDKPDCAHAGVIVSSTHPRATTENRLTIARLILNQVTDFSMIVC
jgi:hypothetical protein